MIQIIRDLPPGAYKISDVFPDIRNIPVLSEIFGSDREIEYVLENTKVILTDKRRYMAVDNRDASVYIALKHLETSAPEILYLDIIHELVHVKQQREGLDLYDKSRSYVDRQTEIDAYEVTVKEARRIGFDDEQILNYLWVEWITPEEHKRLARRLKVAG
jgi:hypothetical protein